jgi:hypothetical protein
MKRSVLIVGGAAALVAVLAGTAFLAGRLLSQGRQAAAGAGSLLVSTGSGDTVRVSFESAEQLPGSAPDVAGFFARREDNRIFVGETTDAGFVLTKGEDGSFATNTSGVQTEVVVTNDTMIYVDVTASALADATEGDTVRQQLRAGSLDEIGDYSIVMAWGDRRGDRLIARVLVYHRPPVLSR